MIFSRTTTFENVWLPDVLYKYRKWNHEKERRLITDFEIYFSQPFETDIVNELNFEVVTDYLAPEKLFDYYYKKTGDTVFAVQKSKTFQLPDNYAENIRKYLNEHFYIFCVSVKKDSYRLWETFADLQRGFCVGIDMKKLLSLKEELRGSGKIVSYYPANQFPKLRPYYFNEEESFYDLQNVICSQSEINRKEDEYRFCKIDISQKAIDVQKEKDCIKEVMLGSQFPKDEEEKAIKLIRTNFPNCKIYRTICDYDNQFIYFNEIHLT